MDNSKLDNSSNNHTTHETIQNHSDHIEQNNERLFEFPLNDKIRQFLKAEHLSLGIAYHLNQDSFWNVQACISLLFELSQLLDRSEIKGKTLQDLERIRKWYEYAVSMDMIPHDKTTKLKILALQSSFDTLSMVNGPFNLFTKNDFLITLRQRFSTSQSQCSFESPAFYRFATQHHEDRVIELKALMMPMLPMLSSIELILKLTREAGIDEGVLAHSGRFEKSLNAKVPLQLIQIKLDASESLYPEISNGKHQLFINFIEQQDGPKQTTHRNIPFKILCSTL